MTIKRTLLAIVIVLFAGASAARAANIVWVSDQVVNTTTGLLPDEGFVTLLTANGHTVTRYNPPAAGAIPAGDVVTLNAADLIILGRSMNSTAFDAVEETQPWNVQVTKPVLCMSGNLTRQVRLGWFVADGITDVLASRLTFPTPADPVSAYLLANAAQSGGTTTNNMFQQITLPAGGVDRGMSVNTNAPITGGTELATTTDLANGRFIVALPAGTSIPAGVSAGQALGGYRMQFLGGNREAAPGPDNNIGSAGFENLTPEGEALFLRAVQVALAAGVSPVQVTNANDAGPGSLRWAVANAAASPGPDTITFAPGLTGPITLTTGEIVLNSSVTIDASHVPGGVTISGNNASRIFTVNSGTTVTLTALTLTNGSAFGGGGIYNLGTLTVNQSTLRGNFGGTGPGSNGGGIFNGGTLTVNGCTLSQNHGSPGGIYNSDTGTATVNQSTFSGNTTGSGAAGLGNAGPMIVNHCTVSGNPGGIWSSGILTLSNSIVAGNTTGPQDVAIYDGSFTRVGQNII